MLVTMIVIASLLAGAAVLASIQASSNHSTELTRNGLASLYCAEAGLTAARDYVTGNYSNWNTALAASCADDGDCTTLLQPAWLDNTIFIHDLDGDGVDDYTISIRDNDDDTLPEDYTKDKDSKVFIVSRCIQFPDTPKQVEELIYYKPAMNPYQAQGGGANSSGNDNNAPIN
jgi:hypothetical protein